MQSYLLKILLALLAFYCSEVISAQNDPCQALLQKRVPTLEEITLDPNQFKQDSWAFLKCGLDSLEVKYFFSGPVIGSMLLGYSERDDLNYDVLFEVINKMKSDPEYPKMKKGMQFLYEPENIPAHIDNWEEDKLCFEKMGMNEEELSHIEQLLTEQSHITQSYLEFFSRKSVRRETDDLPAAWDFENLTMDEAFEVAHLENKPVLIYFAESSSVSSIKMEEGIFLNPTIERKLKLEFIFVSLKMDDSTPLPNGHPGLSHSLAGSIKTYGDYYAQWKLDNYPKKELPFFVLLDSEQSVFEVSGYQNSLTLFLEFLNRGLANFKK